MFESIKELFSKDGHITELDSELSEDIQGIKMHFAGLDGVDENRIVIREYSNGAVGEVLVRAEYEQVSDEWSVLHPSGGEYTRVPGKDSYERLAGAIEEYFESEYQ